MVSLSQQEAAAPGLFGVPIFQKLASDQDRSLCRAHIRVGSRSFFTASLLLPASLRDGAYALYSFCRFSDDLVDEQGGAEGAVSELRRRLDLAYARQPADSPIDRAFSDVVTRYAIPKSLPAALIDGMEWDVRGVRCDNLSDLYGYSACVAGSVGAMMTVLMGVRDEETLARACDLGVAMQLTNIARDVGEDGRNGRLYLPRDWLAEAGIDPDSWLRAPVFSPALAQVIARLLDQAELLYQRADSGIRDLPASCRPAIFAARHLYREIGIEVARRGFDSVTARARVSGKRKLALAGGAVIDALFRSPSAAPFPPLAETSALVQAAARPRALRRSYSEKLIWVAELLISLESRKA